MEELKSTKQNGDILSPIDDTADQQQRYNLSGKSVQDLAHLAKNIIQMVSGSVEIMELGLERKQYDRVRKSWEIFHPNFIRLKEFLLDLIKYTKHYPIQKTECDLNQLAQKAIRSCEYILKRYQVKIRLHIDKQIPVVLLDSERILEAISNLIIHAMDNLPDHNGIIEIQTKHFPDSQQIQLSVTDNGPLLTNELIESLSEPFERTRNMCGTGFDIPLAKIYIEQHDGYMEFESTSEKGNCVHVYLPIP